MGSFPALRFFSLSTDFLNEFYFLSLPVLSEQASPSWEKHLRFTTSFPGRTRFKMAGIFKTNINKCPRHPSTHLSAAVNTSHFKVTSAYQCCLPCVLYRLVLLYSTTGDKGQDKLSHVLISVWKNLVESLYSQTSWVSNWFSSFIAYKNVFFVFVFSFYLSSYFKRMMFEIKKLYVLSNSWIWPGEVSRSHVMKEREKRGLAKLYIEI